VLDAKGVIRFQQVGLVEGPVLDRWVNELLGEMEKTEK
jgi:hypothetical protein